MSVIRPVLSGNQTTTGPFFDAFEVDPFVLLQPVTITSVVADDSNCITVSLNDPNSGADHTNYRYHPYRSVDGGPFVCSAYTELVTSAPITNYFYTVSAGATGWIPCSVLSPNETGYGALVTAIALPSVTCIAMYAPLPTGALANTGGFTLVFDTVAETATQVSLRDVQ